MTNMKPYIIHEHGIAIIILIIKEIIIVIDRTTSTTDTE